MEKQRYHVWYINPPISIDWATMNYVFPSLLYSSDSREKAIEVAKEKVKDMEDGRGAAIYDNETKTVVTQFMKEGGKVKEKPISKKSV